MDTLQILGLCRFSVPSLGSFQGVPDEIHARRRALYVPERLTQRLCWFEHVALPGLRDQTDRGFTLVLLIGEDLPEPWRGRLMSLVGDMPEIIVETALPGDHRAVCADAMRRHVRPGTTLLAQFRLDDDDAVAVNFVERLKRDLSDVLPLLDRKPHIAIDYARGLQLTWDGEVFDPRPVLARMWTPALVFVNRPEADRFILDTQHHRMWQFMPVVTQSDEIMWVRGDHQTNDSRITGAETFELPEGRVEVVLRKKFGITLEPLARALLDIAPPQA